MTGKPSKRIYLVALDASESADQVLDEACKHVSALGGNSELHLIHVAAHVVTVAPMGLPVFVSPEGLLEGGRKLIDRAVARAGHCFDGTIVGHVVAGEPWREITETASRIGAELIIVGTAGRTGLSRMALGSVADKVVRHAPCSVLVVRSMHEAHADAHAAPA
ncbi:MAG: Universal stress protein UspA [Labilithrix sp.]|nr:Universal stress protein UspA [Labilithrix sp.]